MAQAHVGRPITTLRWRFFSTGFGISVWQRQQTRLSSGFHVPHLGQSICECSSAGAIRKVRQILAHAPRSDKR